MLPTSMLGDYSTSASSMPFEFFHRRFDLLEACFQYVVTRPPFDSARLQTGRLLR
jgi:hypothetical protein